MASNDFIILVDDFAVPAAADPNKCRVFGFLVDVAGAPLRNSEIHVHNKYIPQIVTDPGAEKAVLGQKVIFKTDTNGFVEFDLFRNAEVAIMIPSQNPSPFIETNNEDKPLFNVTIPDVASVALENLLFPVADSVEFLGTSPLVVAIDATVTEKVKILLTNTFVVEDTTGVLFKSSDDTLVTVAKAGEDVDGDQTITLTRLAAGSVFITAEVDPDVIQPAHQPAKVLTLIVNTVEDPSGFEVT
jgi:CBS domain-containing protein